MKAIILQLFAFNATRKLKPPVYSGKNFLKISWLQKKKDPLSKQLANDPQFWDVEWFNNYE